MSTTPADLLTALNWRYATKVFDPTKKIPEDTWKALEESLVLTPSSFGLQPWKFLVIQDQELREQLVAHSWRQRQVADCSHLVVMATKRAMNEADIDANLMRIAEVRGTTGCTPRSCHLTKRLSSVASTGTFGLAGRRP